MARTVVSKSRNKSAGGHGARTPAARHQRLLKAGFFPPELPPCFNSEKFGRFRASLQREFAKEKHSIKGKILLPDIYFQRYQKTIFHYPRFKSQDRKHSVINPMSFYFLSKVIADHYITLRKLEKRSKISASTSIFDWTGSRSLHRPIFDARDTSLERLHTRFEYVLSTDIQAFYHSIYTHSISWAVHKKSIAKKSPNDLSLLGNLLDLLVRNGQDGQTIGLPVGPDTSRLIAEIIATAIDENLSRILKCTRENAIRFVDDFAFGSNNLSHIEKDVTKLRNICGEFELEINHSKTKIDTNITFVDNKWKSYLRKRMPKPDADIDDIKSFFFDVGEIAKSLPNVNVQLFALKISRRLFIETQKWSEVLPILLRLYMENRTLIAIICEIIVVRSQNNLLSDLSVIVDFLQSRLPVLIDRAQHGEAIWFLYVLVCVKIEISSKSLENFFEVDEPHCAILIADADKKGLISGPVNYSKWNSAVNTDGLHGPMWLYAYEPFLQKFNISMNDIYIVSHLYFRHLYSRDIRFLS